VSSKREEEKEDSSTFQKHSTELDVPKMRVMDNNECYAVRE
jgi:hypothetical protein